MHIKNLKLCEQYPALLRGSFVGELSPIIEKQQKEQNKTFISPHEDLV